MINDAKFDEGTWRRVPQERGTRDVIVGNIYIPSESNSSVNDIQGKFGWIVADERGNKMFKCDI